MFSTDGLKSLYGAHRTTLKTLGAVETALQRRFVDMDGPIRAVILAAASGEALLLVGPPGTAKSRLIRAFCEEIGVIRPALGRSESSAPPTQDGDYFEYLLTPFTEPSELFGYFNLAKAHGGDLVRDDKGMMQHARVVFLDEIFNASSAILNALLTFMNERQFHDRGRRIPARLRCLFSASNQVPQSGELQAVFDRFLLRCWVGNEPASPERIGSLLRAGWRETHTRPQLDQAHFGLLDRLDDLQADIEFLSSRGSLSLEPEAEAMARLAGQVAELRRQGYSEVSNRRLVKFAKVMLINGLYRAARKDLATPQLGPEDRLLLLDFGTDRDPADLRHRIGPDMARY